MNSREKLLVVGVGIVAVFWTATTGVSTFRDVRAKNYRMLKSVKKELARAEKSDARGREAQKRIYAWAKQSLPTDLDVAKSLYEDWLREQLIESGLYVTELNDKSSGGGNKRFQEISFLVSAEGSLAQLSDFLYRFYRAGHLHRVSEANLTPSKEGGTLVISLTIDALSLEDCKRTDRLSERLSNTPLPPLEEVSAAIVSRNIFAPYRPALLGASNGSEQSTTELDQVLAQARFTAMTYGQGGWQMAIRMEESGDILFFREGDSIEIGPFVGQIANLEGREAIVTLKKQRVLVRLGQYLSQATPLLDQAG